MMCDLVSRYSAATQIGIVVGHSSTDGSARVTAQPLCDACASRPSASAVGLDLIGVKQDAALGRAVREAIGDDERALIRYAAELRAEAEEVGVEREACDRRVLIAVGDALRAGES